MVSQGAQTNGYLLNGRKLIKSYSEAGNKFGNRQEASFPLDTIISSSDHEPLQRTQSDEPPRSPFMVTESPPLPQTQPQPQPQPLSVLPTQPLQQPQEIKSDSSSLSLQSDSDKKEIFIDFKPQISTQRRPLIKTVSDGEILVEQKRDATNKTLIGSSLSHENIMEEERSFTPYFQKAPIRNEGICHPLLENNIYSSLSFDDTNDNNNNNMQTQDSIEEEFHENLIYNKMFQHYERGYSTSPIDECVVPSVCLLPDRKLSPFASNDSLTNDIRDHSDGIWNESQATVLQVDSGTDNGTALSSSEMTSVASPGSTTLLLTPSSRRRHLLMMQHQQRSSIDTEALEEEVVETVVSAATSTNATSPRIVIDKPQKTKQFLAVTPSPSTWRRNKMMITPEITPSESPQPAIVPDLLARTDSCKTNTDVSESTTTDDYITANSGTDSSRKSGSVKGVELYNFQHLQEAGSSFESSKGGDVFGDDMVVPSFSPPLTIDDTSLSNTPVPEVRTTITGRSSPSDSSSSCGSYSVDGSCPDLLERSKVPSAKKQPCGSEDERTVQYESPISPIDDGWKDVGRGDKVRRPFTLDISKQETRKTNLKKDKLSPSSTEKLEKPKRSKSRTKSPIKTHKKHYQMKKSPVNKFEENKVTSDESSCDIKYQMQASPRKNKKNKENNRRKSLPRSPTSSKRKSDEEKSTSLPGSLSRRKSKKESPPVISPKKTPPRSPEPPTTTKLKALSAESLRSVSPGSDSVFYSDPSSHTADHQVHCLHCGKEVDIVTTDDPDKSISSNSQQQQQQQQQVQDIVQPPAGFEDSPRTKHITGRLYKKLERKFRSEDRCQNDYRRHKYRPDVRAKSEERGARTYKSKLRPMAKSTNNSQEILKATDSSPSVLPGAPDDEDDQGIYDVPYLDGCWIYIDERDEVKKKDYYDPGRRDSVSSTESEQEFRKKYQAVTHRMVHRKSCLEMYKRQTSKSFECDKTVVVHRESGEFGFRIHGSKPVVVSAIEPGTPAESSGLEVGDIVLAVNGVSVLDKSHSEVVKIAHAGSDTLTLDVARTCYALNTSNDDHSSQTLFGGYLWKLSGYASGAITNKWIRRWFCLKENNCLYYYKTDSEKQPVGVVMLFDQEVKTLPDDDNSKPFRFLIQKPDAVPLYLAADNLMAQSRWMEVIQRAINDSQTVDEFIEQTKKNLQQAPSSLPKPDCFGYLVKLGTQWKSWSRRYCVLKDACLYFYQDANAKSAFGVAYLQGYRVQQSISGTKKHAFEIIPPDPSKKHYYFHTESDADRKRWIAALEYSIDRWLKIQ